MAEERSGLCGELLSLLYWTMLAACTVGPGTVVTCARAGAEFELHLVWVLIFASLLAYILQEGTARLTIHSGRAYAVIVLALLYKDKTDILGIFLGFIMMAMIILFIIVVALMGINWVK